MDSENIINRSPTIALVSCSRAACTFSGFPCDVISLYPESITKRRATPPARDRRIPKTSFTNPSGVTLIGLRAVETLVHLIMDLRSVVNSLAALNPSAQGGGTAGGGGVATRADGKAFCEPMGLQTQFSSVKPFPSLVGAYPCEQLSSAWRGGPGSHLQVPTP